MRPSARLPRRLAAEGDALPIVDQPDVRYGEKLATPDVSMADLVGEIDPVKVAEGRYLADEETIHYGLVPRTNRGLFAINELPDLTEKVQVGLFNLMEEKDIQIKGYKVRLPLDIVIVASANPEDYTSRGRIITPLKDRFDVQIRTHYPRTVAHEIAIMEQEVPAADRARSPCGCRSS
jgi:magnesium chelatase subunit I